MDRARFDALAKLLATTGSRRAALGALLGAGLFGLHPDALARPGKGRRRKRGRKDHEGEQALEPPVESACGTKRCALPEPGSTRSGCDFNGFNGASFTGQDLHGATFRRIDGRGTSFDGTDNRGSVFAEACLRSASFRDAQLAGSIWGGACLHDADFTDADLGGGADALGGALLCHTILPDGTRNDRDCGVDTDLCRTSAGGLPGQCSSVTDCKDEVCQEKECRAICRYEPVDDGPSPNALCETICCAGECCPSTAYVCVDQEECCQPTFPTDCGLSGACAAACGESCTICANLANGATQCGDVAQLDCRPCTSHADCPASFPTCITGETVRNTSVTLTVAQTCRNQALTASCAKIFPC